MSAPTVLVLGATGKVGGALVEALLPDHAAGLIRLIAGVRRPEVAPAFETRGINTRQIDLDIAETQGLAPIVGEMRGIDYLFLTTGYDVRMLAQSKAAIDAAKAVGARHIVHVGVHAAVDTTIVHFGWHQMIEAYIEKSGVSYTHLHPASFMQNLPLLLAIGGAEPGVIRHYIGEARTSWVDAGDIAAVAVVVLRDAKAHAGQVYPLATEAATMSEIAALITEETDLPWRYEPQEPEVFLHAITEAGTDPIYMACVRNVFERTRKGSLPEAADTFDTVARLTGREPTSLRTFIAMNREAFIYAAGS